MQEVIHLDDRGGGLATIFYGNRRWKRVPDKGSPDAPAQWLDDADHLEAADSEMGHFFEHGYRHPKQYEQVRRFPRLPEPQLLVDVLNAEDLTEKSNLAEANMLLMEGRVGLAHTSRGILVAGRAFNKLKPMFPKGTWLPRLKTEAERSGHSVRSIQEYMKAAKEADAKNAKPRVFAKATDPKAVAITEAGERAAQKVADAITATELTGTTKPRTKKPPRKSPPLLAGRFQLPLYLTGDEKKASKQMLASKHWPRVEKYVTAKWRRVLVKYRYLVLDT